MNSSRREQLEKNYDSFVKKLPGLMKSHAGKFALMKDGEIVDFFDTPLDAVTAGKHLYKQSPFSVQEVIDTPLNLGIFSHAHL